LPGEIFGSMYWKSRPTYKSNYHEVGDRRTCANCCRVPPPSIWTIDVEEMKLATCTSHNHDNLNKICNGVHNEIEMIMLISKPVSGCLEYRSFNSRHDFLADASVLGPTSIVCKSKSFKLSSQVRQLTCDRRPWYFLRVLSVLLHFNQELPFTKPGIHFVPILNTPHPARWPLKTTKNICAGRRPIIDLNDTWKEDKAYWRQLESAHQSH
jgi:hypothetical protein